MSEPTASRRCPGPFGARPSSRRDLLRAAGNGFGLLGLGYLLGREAQASMAPGDARNPLAGRPGHFPARARRCISLFMTGGPSQMDLFDPKPLLDRLDGKPLPRSFGKIETPFVEDDPICLGSRRKWGKYGQSGMDMSDLVPELHQHADSIALIRSCFSESAVHAPAMYQLNTGRVQMGYPSLGSWVTYGLGSEAENLPAFVVLAQPGGIPDGGAPCWGAGFLPAVHQATFFNNGPSPILNLKAPDDFPPDQQRATLDLLRAMNDRDREPDDGDFAARIATYELAYRMQSSAPEAVDLSREPESVRALYGLDDPKTAGFGSRCLLARRLVERGVRFVQVYAGGGQTGVQWDAHDDLEGNHRAMARSTDRPVAALLTDLKRTGLLDDTLVIWGGEFGRTPACQKGNRGRDHNPTGFSMWMAGGGIRGGSVLGATDEIGLRAIEDRVHPNDVHATILHLMGLDHEQLTYLHNGRDERLTDVGGMVLKTILA